jgi:hypothetical protein
MRRNRNKRMGGKRNGVGGFLQGNMEIRMGGSD